MSPRYTDPSSAPLAHPLARSDIVLMIGGSRSMEGLRLTAQVETRPEATMDQAQATDDATFEAGPGGAQPSREAISGDSGGDPTVRKRSRAITPALLRRYRVAAPTPITRERFSGAKPGA